MPRKLRKIIPNYPNHIVQRGHNKQNIFLRNKDYSFYLEKLKHLKHKYLCDVYSFCLMTNHVHLIINPRSVTENLSNLMKLLSGAYTQYFNSINNSKGTLWEGRFRSDPIGKESYLLVCSRYIELNPVRAGMVKTPEDYHWSSYRHKIGLETLDWLDLDPCYMALGNRTKERQNGYESWVKANLGSDPGLTPGF